MLGIVVLESQCLPTALSAVHHETCRCSRRLRGHPCADISSHGNSQTTTSSGITGVVTDSSGAVVPDAQVELKQTAKGVRQNGTTDREGRYFFPFLRPGGRKGDIYESG